MGWGLSGSDGRWDEEGMGVRSEPTEDQEPSSVTESTGEFSVGTPARTTECEH